MNEPIKLSDKHVRKLLAIATAPNMNPRLAYTEHRATVDETAALAQAVLDLRTANGLLEAMIARAEKGAGL